MLENLPQFVSSGDLEVQERASSAYHMVQFVDKMVTKNELHILEEIGCCFMGVLNPVAPKAQKKVQLPQGCLTILHFCKYVLASNDIVLIDKPGNFFITEPYNLTSKLCHFKYFCLNTANKNAKV